MPSCGLSLLRCHSGHLQSRVQRNIDLGTTVFALDFVPIACVATHSRATLVSARYRRSHCCQTPEVVGRGRQICRRSPSWHGDSLSGTPPRAFWPCAHIESPSLTKVDTSEKLAVCTLCAGSSHTLRRDAFLHSETQTLAHLSNVSSNALTYTNTNTNSLTYAYIHKHTNTHARVYKSTT